MEKEKIYEKIVAFPQKLFGENLYKIFLEGGNIQDITCIPSEETYTYTLKIIVDIPYKEMEQYADKIKSYYKKKTENTAFKIEAELLTRLIFKIRNRNGILPLGTAVLYDSEPPRPRPFLSPSHNMIKRMRKTNRI